ncbi:MAG TPA: thioredoxin domain-containing protein [Longimicrobium sp.]|jgi:protein-disulfide isomerase|nr:thioredoxin domain-containing protein [Longimicrobium sp.]
MSISKPGRVSTLYSVVVISCAVVITALVVRRELFPPSAPRPGLAAESVPNWRAFASMGHRTGPANAPVTLVVFSDFQCPACKVLADEVRTLRERYPERFTVLYRHYPLPSHSQAVAAARASECAARQGRFAAYHDALFASQETLGYTPWQTFARSAGVPDVEAFQRCFSEPGRIEQLVRDVADGGRLGVTGTPTLLINGRRYNGAPPLEVLEKEIEEQARTGG